MNSVWIISDCIVSPLGSTTRENYENILMDKTGIRKVDALSEDDMAFYGSVMADLPGSGDLSRFETIAVEAGRTALGGLQPPDERTILIISTTKGNVEFLPGRAESPRLSLHGSARHIAVQLGFSHSVVVSNACISGVLGVITARRLLSSGRFDHALVIGADVLSHFIVAGFRSLQALSAGPCRPFDKGRAGITLGEGAGAILLTADPDALKRAPFASVAGEGLSNDANHISGPSRTGKELALAIAQALKSAQIGTKDVDAIYAHGTATVFNDEMEAKAFALSEMGKIPLNSLKGYFGHTLGAAGVIETIIATHAMHRNEIPGTKGFREPGVPCEVNVVGTTVFRKQEHILKTASGFGGCNAALVLKKI